MRCTPRCVKSEAIVNAKSFLRQRSAVFFTFFFPAILILIFGVLVQTEPGTGGLFTEPPEYYLAGYVAVVVIFTPLSRLSSEVARYTVDDRFEKLSTTPVSRLDWLLAQTIVNAVIVLLASVLILALAVVLTDAVISIHPIAIAIVLLGVVCFCGMGALIGRFTDSRDGAIAASNAIGLPLLFLSDTFVPASQLPAWFRPFIELSPLTYFSRSFRASLTSTLDVPGVFNGDPLIGNTLLLGALALAFLYLGARSIPLSH